MQIYERSLGKLKNVGKLGDLVRKNSQILGKFEVRPKIKKKKKKKGPHLILVGKLGKLSQIRKIYWVN